MGSSEQVTNMFPILCKLKGAQRRGDLVVSNPITNGSRSSSSWPVDINQAAAICSDYFHGSNNYSHDNSNYSNHDVPYVDDRVLPLSEAAKNGQQFSYQTLFSHQQPKQQHQQEPQYQHQNQQLQETHPQNQHQHPQQQHQQVSQYQHQQLHQQEHQTTTSTHLPLGWTMMVDPSSSKKYYVNEVSHTTQWEIPTYAATPSPLISYEPTPFTPLQEHQPQQHSSHHHQHHHHQQHEQKHNQYLQHNFPQSQQQNIPPQYTKSVSSSSYSHFDNGSGSGSNSIVQCLPRNTPYSHSNLHSHEINSTTCGNIHELQQHYPQQQYLAQPLQGLNEPQSQQEKYNQYKQQELQWQEQQRQKPIASTLLGNGTYSHR